MFEARVAELETLAREQGLDFFPVSFEVVPQDIMTEVAAYGLPTRARHWSYGKVYQHQHLYGTMGLSKIYEIVLNSDPGLAFLLDSNPEIANLLVTAHVFGHVDFFKNNLCFADTNRHMVNDAVTYAVEGERFPPYPERDLLWFLITYAPLEGWQRDVLQIIREESSYFYPQFNTKILNEGWASYWHAELFHLYEGVAPDEMIEFARLHAGVVNPGGRFAVNPYYLGYSILVDIEKRWDQMHAAGETPLTGREKLFEVRRTEDDLSFLRNYLTPELVQRLNLFAYGSNCTHPPGKQCPQCQTVVITARERDAVVEALLAPRYNYGVPRIVIQDVVNNTLCLEHLDRATTFLDRQYTNNTLMYIAEIWKHPVHLLTGDEDGRDTTLTARPNL